MNRWQFLTNTALALAGFAVGSVLLVLGHPVVHIGVAIPLDRWCYLEVRFHTFGLIEVIVDGEFVTDFVSLA